MSTIAIIGTGIAGLGCAHKLQSKFTIDLYEQNDYPGGHTHTLSFPENGSEVHFDTGFMVYNEVTYPNLTRLFRELNVKIKPTQMSFSVQNRLKNLEFNGSSLNHLFIQRRNLFNVRFIRTLLEINRFNEEALSVLKDPAINRLTLNEFANRKGYSRNFLYDYLIPMSGAVWSTPPDLMLEFPIFTLIRFFYEHGFLGLSTQRPWLTVDGGAKNYVAKITAPFRDKINLKQKVTRVTRVGNQMEVKTISGQTALYDRVILACHADESYAMLSSPSEKQTALLTAFTYQPNPVLVHTDPGVMPRTVGAWASWNVRLDAGANGGLISSTHYWMNSLQNVSTKTNYFVSLNSAHLVQSNRILRRIDYAHPLFNIAAITAQEQLHDLNLEGKREKVYFCGSYFKYGFHEDALSSAITLADQILQEG